MGFLRFDLWSLWTIRDGVVGEPTKFICLGHHKKYHSNGVLCSGETQCPGHSRADNEWSFHGDPNRDHKFWIYPKKSNIVIPRWDFRVNPCSNAKLIKSSMFTCWAEYQCLGHHSSHQTITRKKGVSIWTKVFIGVSVALGALAVGATIIAIASKESHKPCTKC